MSLSSTHFENVPLTPACTPQHILLLHFFFCASVLHASTFQTWVLLLTRAGCSEPPPDLFDTQLPNAELQTEKNNNY
ncbi:hypothetical protein BU24DRAFT_420154 [Aaosphaeria arxii CBS 175.79]|uniref:Uncharacterized protein n=1 Tax=Aaosphaeria arxii CBS 175.79 TaxID=1450172 RepID=A0A6A5XWW2_9PLEO|nr:uncharacterized protein BU24DRAFT_420154 [Aaosphaeria arxii CBS 175.79]KAF2017130.1 hypothetical protein BU24DRAFT_420154 [Aaosphaeria arxii CBS 175.79]